VKAPGLSRSGAAGGRGELLYGEQGRVERVRGAGMRSQGVLAGSCHVAELTPISSARYLLRTTDIDSDLQKLALDDPSLSHQLASAIAKRCGMGFGSRMSGLDAEMVFLESPSATANGHGGYPCEGIYFRKSSTRPKAAIIASHYSADWATHDLAEYVANRGYGFLGWNTRYSRAVQAGYWALEHALIDIGVGVNWLRSVAGVEMVAIMGNSGGASLMGAYQAQANTPHIDPGSAPLELLTALPAADLYISLAAHTGRPEIMTQWLDPTVADESDPLSYDPAAPDMFDPANGPAYSPEFIAAYRAAQIARNEKITQWAIAALERVADGRPKGIEGIVDVPFSVYRGWADPRFLDLTLDPSERKVGCYAGDPRTANWSGLTFVSHTSAREWLAMWSMSKSQVLTELNLPLVTQPALIIQSSEDQGVFPSHAQAIHDQLRSTDKRVLTVRGDHYLTSPPAARDQAGDLIADWLEDHGAVRIY
jgi:hypothetical protein